MPSRRDGGGERQCPQCGAELTQKVSENDVFVCLDCGGSQLR